MEYTISNLKNTPYLAVAIAPQRYDDKMLAIERCEEVITTCQVRKRGWYFPHVSKRDGIIYGASDKFIAGEVEWDNHVERWRMYRSGNFLFQGVPWEIPNTETQAQIKNYTHSDSREDFVGVKGFIEFIMLIYSISEVYVFASRLAQAIPYDTAVDITVGLHNVKDFAIGSYKPEVFFHGRYIARNNLVEHQASVSLDELVANPLSAATIAILSLYRQFGLRDQPAEEIENWQRQIFK